MTRTIPVFVNAARVDVRDDASALDAVRAWRADAAREVEEGTLLVTDSRGLPIDAASRVHGGAIFRLVRAREQGAGDPSDAGEA